MKPRTAQLRLVHSNSSPEQEEPVDFDSLFLRYSAYAAAVAFRIMGNEDDVDDIVQDVFMEVHKGIASLKSTRHVKGWLATITVRTCAKKLRVKKLQRLLAPSWSTLSELEDFDIPQEGLSPEEQVWLKKIYTVLDSMAVPLRLAWTLRYLQGEQLEQVAKMCGCSLATVKRRVANAHQTIRKAVDNE